MSKDCRIYNQDRLFCAKSEKGDWYIASTTENPEARKFGGMNYIAKIESFPGEEVRTGESEPVGKGPNPKMRWYLDKEKLRKTLKNQYRWEIVDEDSPYLPKKLSIMDDDPPEGTPSPARQSNPKRRRDEEEEPNSCKRTEIMDKLREIERLLLAIHSSRVIQYETKTSPVDGGSTDEIASD
jgi:hypothetical protein